LNIQHMTLVNLTPAQTADAIVVGAVDAVAVFQPHASSIKMRMGAGVVIWPAQSSQLGYFTIVGSESWLDKNQAAAKRLLTALIQAETYVLRNPEEARAIIQQRFNYNDTYMDEIWKEHRFTVSLDQGLVAAMDDEARWMIKNKLTDARDVPDFIKRIHVETLASMKPGAVNIIR